VTRTASPRPEGTARVDGEPVVLVADGVGLWTPWVAVGQVVEPGQTLGVLEVLGVTERVLAGGDRGGRAIAVTGARHHRDGVDFGAALVTLDPSLDVAAAVTSTTAAAAAATTGLVLVAPSSGRFYGRAAPGKPAFVSAGDVVRAGQTVCLLEVMKTFHRVTYGGPGLPDAARVTRVAIADDADVMPGDVILYLAPVEEEAP
jgi:acetyl-CoA carboxylase biotin carboxyl carrier protein